MTTDRTTWTVSNWNAWVEAGEKREEWARRLDEVPANLRTEVESHVRCAFEIRSASQRKRVAAQSATGMARGNS